MNVTEEDQSMVSMAGLVDKDYTDDNDGGGKFLMKNGIVLDVNYIFLWFSACC